MSYYREYIYLKKYLCNPEILFPVIKCSENCARYDWSVRIFTIF